MYIQWSSADWTQWHSVDFRHFAFDVDDNATTMSFELNVTLENLSWFAFHAIARFATDFVMMMCSDFVLSFVMLNYWCAVEFVAAAEYRLEMMVDGQCALNEDDWALSVLFVEAAEVVAIAVDVDNHTTHVHAQCQRALYHLKTFFIKTRSLVNFH